MHTSVEILRAAAEWVWLPRGSENETRQLRLVRYPERFGGGVRGSQVDSEADAADVLDHALARTRAWGESELLLWTSASDRPDLEPELRRRGAEHIDTVTVFACPVDEATVDVPVDAAVEIVRTLDQLRELDAINVPVWQQQPLDDEGLRTELDEITERLEAGAIFRVLARLDGEAVSAGGCTIVDGFARLWGAATVADARGRGAYRAVLAERLRVSATLGARTALVKGRIATSAPILARAGFIPYGEERCYRLTV